jgi:hypothetical protein
MAAEIIIIYDIAGVFTDKSHVGWVTCFIKDQSCKHGGTRH